MAAAIRFILYNAFSSLAKLFIDQQVKKHAGKIFELVDRDLPVAISTGMPAIVGYTIESSILCATGLASVDERQVQQVRDLFDPIKFVARKLK